MLCMAFASCEVVEMAPDLTVSVVPAQVVNTINDTTVVYAGQEIEFNISGNPDMITFFSGEGAHIYANRDRTIAQGTPKMDFYLNTNRVTVDHKLDVLASLDFKGKYDSINIKTATWDTLTTPEMDAYRNTSSAKAMPTINLSKYGNGQAMFVAFRLVIPSSARFSNPSISAFQIRNYQNDGNISPVADKMSAAGMSFVTLSENATWKLKGVGNSYWKISSEALTVNTTPFLTVAEDSVFNAADGRFHEIWAISKVLYLDKASPDTGVTIKDIQAIVENYKYTYTKAGTYTVTFVAANTGPTGVLQSTIKEMIIKVIDKPAF